MKFNIDCNGYDTILQPTDWRYAAATFGLVKYLEFHNIEYSLLYEIDDKPTECISGFDGVLYNQEEITPERYLKFVEYYFKPYMTHTGILNILNNAEFDDEQINTVNSMLKSKTVFNKVIGKDKFTGNNSEHFKSRILENRFEIVKEIYRNGKNLYSNFCNKNLLLTADNPHCRLVGYNVDEGRKTKFLGFCFSKDSFSSNDIPEYDFIPFAFSNPNMYETFFVNNNYSVKKLVNTNNWLSDKLNEQINKDSKNALYNVLKNAEMFIDFDVEIIVKNREEEFYKSLFARSQRLKALRMLNDRELNFVYKLGEDNWLNLEKEVSENCLNGVYLDNLIIKLLRVSLNDDVDGYLVRKRIQSLIEIDQSWKGNDIMTEIESAKRMGFIVSQELQKQKKANKINSYKQKLIGALTAHDYDRVNEIILSLSSYVGMEFSFFYSLLENPEENKNIALAFASALTTNTYSKGE